MEEYANGFSLLKKSDLGKIHDFSTEDGRNVFYQYLRGEFKQGSYEHTISFTGDGLHFVIHPSGKDGDILDFVLTKSPTI